MEQKNRMIAVCGLPCYSCDILKASTDPAKAKKEAEELTELFKKEIKPEEVFCEGCKGDRSRHWSPDCWILKCCVDDKGLEFCYQCSDFPCAKLEEWSNENEAYRMALEWLKEMKEGKI